MSDLEKVDVEAALDSLAVTAERVKSERDALLSAAKSLRNLIDNTVSVFQAHQLRWLQEKPTYGRFVEAIEEADRS